MRMALLFSLCLLVASARSAAPSTLLAVAGAPSSITVAGSVNTVYYDLFQQSLLAYQLQVPSFTGVRLSVNSGDNGRLAAATGNFDWTIASNSLEDRTRAVHPTLESYPFATVAIVAAYNLPASVGTATLAIHNEVLCRIWRGDITHWNDPAIVATNPGLNLPAERIRVVQFDFVNDSTLAAARLCTKVDPVWAATIGASKKPELAHVVRISQAQNGGGFASFVLDNPWTIGVVSPSATKTRTAELINQAGKNVAPSTASVAQAFLELAANGILEGGNGFDLSNAQSAYAWPMNMGAWLFVDKDSVRSTCATKAEVLKFLVWMYESPVVASLAESANIALPPALYLKQSGLLDRMRKEILCDGSSLVRADSTSASIRGNAMLTAGVSLMTQLYGQVDTTYSYSFRTMSDSLALDRIAVGEIDFAIVNPLALSSDQSQRFRSPNVDPVTGEVTRGGILLPAFIVGVVPTFSLPVAVTALYATRSVGDDLGLPDLYPLQIDLEALAEVFTGSITSWMDPRMLDLNPQLEAWFTRAAAPTALKSVVCCTDSTDPFVAGSMFVPHLLETRAFNRTLSAATIAAAHLNPRSLWKTLQALHTAPSPMSFVDREATVPSKLSMQLGSISYRTFSTAYAVDTSDFMLRQVDMDGVVESVPAHSDNLMMCVEPFVGDASFMQFLITGSGEASHRMAPGCWPLQGLASLAVSAAFSSKNEADTKGVVVGQAAGDAAASHRSECVRAQKNLELLRWMQVNPVLSAALRNSGIVRLSDLPAIRSFLVDQRLNSATCDGKTILITLPIIWEVPGSATGFAIALSSLIILACVIAVAGLYKYRHHPMIRSASPIFLAQVAVGLALLAGSLIAWASPVTDSSCLAFQWLVDLGFTLAFAPLFAKTWRIYQIFSAKKIKVVKITNGRLVWAVLAMLAFELVVLSVWTGVSPLQPVLYEQPTNQLDGAIRQLTHCAVEGTAGTAFLAIEASFKGALLLFGCLMGFSTRRVAASFNESSTIAWAIYNVVFTSLVVGAILLFLDTIGDTLIWLVLILFLWIAVGTWLLIFVPKATAVIGGEEKLHYSANSISLGSLSKHDGSITFASITGMGRAQLQAYRMALEAQLEKIKKALGLATTKAQHEGALLDPRSNVSHGQLDELGPSASALSPVGGHLRTWPAKSRTLGDSNANDATPVDDRHATGAMHVPSPTVSGAVPRRPLGAGSSGMRPGLTVSTNRLSSLSQNSESVSMGGRALAAGAPSPPAQAQAQTYLQPSRAPLDQAPSPTGEVLQLASSSSPSASAMAWGPNDPLPAHLYGPSSRATVTSSSGSAPSTPLPEIALPAPSLSIDVSAPAAPGPLRLDAAPTSPMRVAVSLAPRPSSRAQGQSSPAPAHARASHARSASLTGTDAV